MMVLVIYGFPKELKQTFVSLGATAELLAARGFNVCCNLLLALALSAISPMRTNGTRKLQIDVRFFAN